MYHPDVIAKRLHLTEQSFGFRLHRYTREQSWEAARLIEKKFDPTQKRYVNLTADEQMFIRNEILLSKCDFEYFTRFCRILLDDETGDEGPLELWSAQARLIRGVGLVEQRLHREAAEGRKRLDGNCWYIHKRRQTGASTVAQAMGLHRLLLWKGMNGLMAGVDETSTLTKLYNKYFYFMLERLPRWMQLRRTEDNNQGVSFANGSSVILQNSTGANVGQGAKWHWAHLTECASWDKSRVSDQIDNHFTNAISASVKGMAFLESTSQGIHDWWHISTELARRNQAPRWNYFFVPWYAIEEISIGYPPEEWEPKSETRRHAEMVERTSPEFMDGVVVKLSPGQLYYWETTRKSFEDKGTLAAFYKNYPATPEESFVPEGRSSFPIEVLTWHDANVREPWAYYDILGPQTPSEIVITEPQLTPAGTYVHPPPVKRFGQIEIGPVYVSDDQRRHPLGLIRVWENPDTVRPYDTYVACDTADGIPDWSRFLRRTEDDKPDRAAIQCFRQHVTRHGDIIDTQIGEFFAPISAISQAPYVVAMSMLLHGRNSIDMQPPVMTELTGTGKILNQELQDRYGWFHFYQDFKFDGQAWEETSKFGWTSTATSVRQLWSRGKQRLIDIRPACPRCRIRLQTIDSTTGLASCQRCHLDNITPVRTGSVIIRSRPLVNEMRICQDDAVYMSILSRFSRGKAKDGSGQHDDLVYTTMFDLWQSNMFNQTPSGSSVAPVQMTIGGQPDVPLRSRDMTPEERQRVWDEWDRRMMGW